MRKLLTVCVAIIAILAIVTVNLWLQLRSERQVIAELRSQALPAQPPMPEPVQPVPAAVAASAVPAVAVQDQEPRQESPPASSVVSTPAGAQVVVSVIRPPTTVTEARREGAMAQSDQTATARVLAWKDRLAMAGHTLSTEQLQALNAAATEQLRRETTESLELETTARPTDLEAVIRMREETINRQNATNQRILAAVSPHLTEEQTKALRAQFDSGHAARMATFRSEQEMLRQSQQ